MATSESGVMLIRESEVYAYGRIERQQGRVECIAAILLESEVNVCKCII